MIEKKAGLIRGVLISASVIFIMTGIFRGEVQTVVTKAVNICLECIGIG